MKWLRLLLLYILPITLGLLIAKCAFADRYLVLVIDISGSITHSEYMLQRKAYANVLSDLDMQASLNGTHIAIVEFGTKATLVHDFTTNYNELADFYWKHQKRSPTGGSTNPEAGIELAVAMLSGVTGDKTIDISGDGPNSESYNSGGYGTFEGKPIRPKNVPQIWKNRLGMLGIIANGIVFDDGNGHAQWYYQRAICNGFVMRIDSLGEFEDSLYHKMTLEMM